MPTGEASRVKEVAHPADRPTETWERDEGAVAWVYGSILAGAAVVVAAGVIASAPGQVLLYTTATMIVVWAVLYYPATNSAGVSYDVLVAEKEEARDSLLQAIADLVEKDEIPAEHEEDSRVGDGLLFLRQHQFRS